MRWSPLRLVQKRWKAIYIIGGLAVTSALFSFVNRLPFEWVASALTAALQLGWIYYGTRIFRGRNELVVSPRAPWRMTAEPTSGFVLGILWLALAAYSILVYFGEQLALAVTGAIEFLLLTGLYLRSSMRLLRKNQR